MTPLTVDLIGWTGVVLVLLAYGLLSISYIDGNSRMYQWLNVAGAGLLVVNSAYLGAYPSVGVNAAWAGIAAVMLVRLWWQGPEKTKPILPRRPRPNLPQRIQLAYAEIKNNRYELAAALQRTSAGLKTGKRALQK